MRYEVREMSFAEILDTGFRLLRDHFVLFVGIAAALNLPLIVLRDALTAATAGSVDWALIVVLLIFALSLAISPIVGVAATYAVGEIYLGRDATLGDAFRKGLAIFTPVIGNLAAQRHRHVRSLSPAHHPGHLADARPHRAVAGDGPRREVRR